MRASMIGAVVTSGLLMSQLAFGQSKDSSVMRGDPTEALPISGVQNFLPVPLVDQGTDFSCGVSALQSVLAYWQPEEDYFESELISDMEVDPDTGVLIGQIKSFAQEQDFRVQVVRNMTLDRLLREIRAGRPVIALIQAWPDRPGPWRNMVDEGHYVVVNGFDFNHIYMMDPSITGNYGYIPTAEFLERWHHEDDEFGKTERIEYLGIVISRTSEPRFRAGMAIRVR